MRLRQERWREAAQQRLDGAAPGLRQDHL